MLLSGLFLFFYAVLLLFMCESIAKELVDTDKMT